MNLFIKINSRNLFLLTSAFILILVHQNCAQNFRSAYRSNSSHSQNDTLFSEDQINKSILITNAPTLNKLIEDLDLAVLIGEVGKEEIAKMKALDKDYNQTVGKYFVNVFDNGAIAQSKYDKYAEENSPARNGPPVPNQYKLDVVFKDWKRPLRSGNFIKQNKDQLKMIKNPYELRSNKFRLLAIANRMDLAGEMDDRITNGVSNLPRYLGEIHLIFGLVDNDYETKNKKAFPTTFVLSYALPPIIKTPSGYALKDVSMYDHPMRELHNSIYEDTKDTIDSEPKKIRDLNEWRSQMKVWVNLWSSLNNYKVTSQLNQDYVNQIKNILSLSIKPENFISLKSNTAFPAADGKTHFELREWYIFKSGLVSALDNVNGGGQLIFRYVRREPFRCLTNSELLHDLITQKYWNEDIDDLDMVTRKELPSTEKYDDYRSGYAILRDNQRDFNSIYVQIIKKASYTNQSGNLIRGTLQYWTPECGDTVEKMPFGMLTGFRRNQDVALTKDDQLFALVPFARVNPNIYAWNVPNVTEKQRHAFAIRTCSGCHSAEGAAAGFHIFPRLENENSRLSHFLTGERTNLNPFRYKSPSSGNFVDGAEHYYADLERRRRWLNSFVDSKKEPILYKSLLVPDINTIEEN